MKYLFQLQSILICKLFDTFYLQVTKTEIYLNL